MDALFTSTSAVCVTGLVVRDTATDFSALGQLIILALFQVGGLGIVTFVAFVSVFSAKALPVSQMVAFRQMISASEMDNLKKRLAGILLLTVLIEGAGAMSLYAFAATGDNSLERLKWSVFHSVSAFCNAGFALQSNNLEAWWNNPALTVTVALLIVLGGLGALVLPELIALAAGGLRLVPHLLHPKSRRFAPHLPRRVSVQTRISLIVTFGLILVGMAGFWMIEAGHILRGRSAGDAFLVSLFQSVTTRTAGFNYGAYGRTPACNLNPPDHVDDRRRFTGLYGWRHQDGDTRNSGSRVALTDLSAGKSGGIRANPSGARIIHRVERLRPQHGHGRRRHLLADAL